MLFIARMYMARLIQTSKWEEAAEIGWHALKTSNEEVPANFGPQCNSELVKIACGLSELGMVGGMELACFRQLLAGEGLDEDAMEQAVGAIKSLVDDDFGRFVQALMDIAHHSPNALLLMDAACAYLDSATASLFACSTFVERQVRTALANADAECRARGLLLVGHILRAAPLTTYTLLPVLITAVLVEKDGIQEFALATIGDVTYALARLPSSDDSSAAVTQHLDSSLKLLASCLYAPRLEMQHIAALSLCKLVVHTQSTPVEESVAGGRDDRHPNSLTTNGRHDGDGCISNGVACSSCLEAIIDPESLLADLAFRYTAERLPKELSKAAAVMHKALMASLLACFDVMRSRPVEVSNTIVWVILGAVEDGSLDAITCMGAGGSHSTADLGEGEVDQQRLSQDMDKRTKRCLRFLSSLLDGGITGNEMESSSAARPGGTREAATIRSAVEAIKLNLFYQCNTEVPASAIVAWLT